MSLDLSADTKTFTSDLAESLIPSLTKDLRSRARTAQWPEDVTNSLEVTFENGAIAVSYPEDIKNKVDNLEYGNLSSLPLPVLRPFALEASKGIAAVLKTRVAEDFFENGGVW